MKKLVLPGFLLIFMVSLTHAQGCALCAKVAADLGSSGARGLNTGIIYLAFIPLAFMGSIGYAGWRYNKRIENPEDE